MNNLRPRFIRPALWGFFVCLGIAGALFLWQGYVPSYIRAQWEASHTKRRMQDEQIIRETFRSRVDRLTEILEQVSHDSVFAGWSNSGNILPPEKLSRVFQLFRRHQPETLDLIDSSGALLAWGGQSVAHRYKDVLGADPAQSFVRVTQSGLRTFVSAGRRCGSGPWYILASEPLELNSPISNRFIQKESISEELTHLLHIPVSLQIPQASRRDHGIQILDDAGKPLVEFLAEDRNLDDEILNTSEYLSLLIGLCLAVASIFLGYSVLRRLAHARGRWIPAIGSILILWALRLLWRELEFPAALMGGWFFDPNVYASHFIGGLSSSLGELILSTIALVVSTWILFKTAVLTGSPQRQPAGLEGYGKRLGAIGALCAISLCLPWCFRGIFEALRSFVFDSTIQFNNPSEILLDHAASVIHLNALFLGVSLLFLSIMFIWIARNTLTRCFSLSKSIQFFVLAGALFFGILLFAFIDESPSVQTAGSLLCIVFCMIFIERLTRWNQDENRPVFARRRIFLWMILGSFFLVTPLFHQWLQERERRDVESVVREYLRPSDSWLTYVLQDGLQISGEEIQNILLTQRLEEAKKNNLAFVLWTKTLLGKNGYNSALVLFDAQGNETDRFVVGMSKQEQQEMLTQTFEGEEEAVHIAGKAGQKSIGKLYGAWTTIRDSSAHFMGSIALLLSEHQRTFFNDPETEPLRQFANRLENDIVRENALYEYEMDSLVYSTGRTLSPEKYLSPDIKEELRNDPKHVVWKKGVVNGKKAQTVYMKDLAFPKRTIAMSLEELDFRWELFSYLKEFFICLSVLALMGLFLFVRKGRKGAMPALGFKDKLFIGFACISLVPLAVLSYYNKQLVAERVQSQMERTLYDELSQIQDRIGTYVTDEEDFSLGVDDDFCEALAAEYGIDFSVYRLSSIHASSRSELYRAELLDRRINGEAYSSIMMEDRNSYLAQEKIGTVQYIVGYAPLRIGGILVGILSVPTLNREKEIEAELAERNAYVFSAYAVLFGLALIGGGILAFRFARPIRQLTEAAQEVAAGNLHVQVKTHARDEIGALAQSFNEMVSKLQKSREELAAHERENAWKEMAKQIAHEIRNPLTPIKLSIQHLRQAFKDNAPEREEILQRVTKTVIEQIDSLSRIASEFSRFAKMPESKFGKIQIETLLKSVVNVFQEVQEVEFVMQFAESPVVLIADEDQLRGVFVNIIRNAIQAMSAGGTITLKTEFQEHLCVIRITDTGPGIADEIRAKIFEPNFSTKTEGMGLGLAIARRAVENHGGTISCFSQHGKGTTFEIRLPA